MASSYVFPAGGKFVHALPAKHPPEDQIIHLELPASHEPLVVAPERLPVACIFNSSLPSSLIDQVDILMSELVLHGFIICLDTQRAHGDFRGKDGLSPIHHEERRLSRGLTGRGLVAPQYARKLINSFLTMLLQVIIRAGLKAL
jgi:hypothetical protein